MSGADPFAVRVRVPAAHPNATRLHAERDRRILEMFAQGRPVSEIAAAVGIQPNHASKRLVELRQQLREQRAEAEARARKYPGFPKVLPCPMCREPHTRRWPGDTHCATCKRTDVWRAA